ncbi:MAG: chalcone isomerase family protein [Alphaproteobacteria bacterium]
MALMASCLGAVAISGAARAMEPLPPRVLQSDKHALVLNGVGTRVMYFMRVYECALYLPERSRSMPFIMDKRTASAIRISVIHDDLPDRLPEQWREAVRSEVTTKMFSRLRAAYRDVSGGDVVLFRYVPTEGTWILINDEVVVFDPGHGLMRSMLEQWVGETPVSSDLRLALMGDSNP